MYLSNSNKVNFVLSNRLNTVNEFHYLVKNFEVQKRIEMLNRTGPSCVLNLVLCILHNAYLSLGSLFFHKLALFS